MKDTLILFVAIVATAFLTKGIDYIVDTIWETKYAEIEELQQLQQQLEHTRDSFANEQAKAYQLYLQIDKKEHRYQQTIDSLKIVLNKNTQNIEKIKQDYETPTDYTDSTWHVIIDVLDGTGQALFDDE